MEALRRFLRGLPSEAAKEAFAMACGTTIGHLRNVSYRQRSASDELLVAIERESKGSLVCEELAPERPWYRLADKSWPNKDGRPLVDVSKVAA